MVHAKNETPANINNAGNTNFNLSFILFSPLFDPRTFHLVIHFIGDYPPNTTSWIRRVPFSSGNKMNM